MTILGTYEPDRYTITAAQLDFNISFEFVDDAHVKATVTDQVTEADTELTQGVDFTIAGTTLTTTAQQTEGDKITLYLDMPFTQNTDYKNTGDLDLNNIEDDYDTAALERQQLAEEQTRNLQVPITSDLDPEDLVADLYQARDDAEAAATAAGVSESNAATSESNALDSEDEAAVSAAAALATEGRIETEGDTQVARVISEGDTQVSRLSTVVAPYSITTDYAAGTFVTKNGTLYTCTAINGPASSVVDPVGDATGTWLYAQRGLAGEEFKLGYEPTTTQLTQMGALERDGSSLLDTDYSELLVVWGSKLYGNVDGTHFYLPDDRGQFERIWDHGAGIDPDVATRTDRGDTTTGDSVGTKETDAFKSHDHDIVTRLNAVAGGSLNWWQGNDTGSNVARTSTGEGGDETRPLNIYKFGGIFVK